MNMRFIFSLTLSAAGVAQAAAPQAAAPLTTAVMPPIPFMPLHDHAKFSDSGVKYFPYDDLVQALATLTASAPAISQLVTYGTSAAGHPLTFVRVQDSTVAPTRQPIAVQISGAIHGNEYLGIEMDIVRALVKDRAKWPGVNTLLAQGGVIYAIPVVNPDGYTDRVRENSKGIDLNRDFDQIPTNDRAFTQPETRDLANYLTADLQKQGLQLRFSLDYHCCGPSTIIPWSYKDAMPDEPDFAVFKFIGDLGTSLLGFDWGNPSKSVGYTAQNSSVDYFYAKYKTFATAIEGRYNGESKYLQKHLQFIDQSISKVLAAQQPQ